MRRDASQLLKPQRLMQGSHGVPVTSLPGCTTAVRQHPQRHPPSRLREILRDLREKLPPELLEEPNPPASPSIDIAAPSGAPEHRARRPGLRPVQFVAQTQESGDVETATQGTEAFDLNVDESAMPFTQGASDDDFRAPVQNRPKSAPKRSATHKQPWSTEERHWLDRLLVEIPAGSTRRWAKISAAMGGRRTTRQVASRVQKYFLAMERLGIDPP